MAFQNSALKLLGNVRGAPGNANSAVDRPYEMNRYMGGHRRQNHPYISGYWYVIIEPPHRLFKDEQQAFQTSIETQESTGGRGSTEAFETARWLHSTAEGFTPPSRTLTKVDVPGLGGVGSSYVAGQQLTRTFTTTHREYQDVPVFSAINRWTSMIDHHYGASPLSGNEYIPANYKGAAWVYLCKPTASMIGGESESVVETVTNWDVEQFYFFEGVFPEGAPFDAFNSDIATNDVVQLSITWSFDGWPYGREHKAAFNKGIELLQTTYAFNFAGTALGHTMDGAKTFNAPTAAVSGISKE